MTFRHSEDFTSHCVDLLHGWKLLLNWVYFCAIWWFLLLTQANVYVLQLVLDTIQPTESCDCPRWLANEINIENELEIDWVPLYLILGHFKMISLYI